jgi:hypothetical protein
MSIPIGTKPPKQKSKTHLQKNHILQKKNLHKALLKLNNEQRFMYFTNVFER